MRVLHVIDSLGRGGAEQLLATVLPELQRHGVEAGVLVRGGAMDLVQELQEKGISVAQLSPRHRWNLLGLACDIGRHARNQRADVVHAHLYFPLVGTALMRFLRLAPMRTCVTFHNLAYAGANNPTLTLAFRRRLAAWLCHRGVDRCLAVSTAVAAHFRRAYTLDRVEVLPNPVDIARLKAFTADVLPGTARGDACRIVLPGRIVPEKGHADLIEAIAILRGSGLSPLVIIAGDGPLRARIEAHVQALELSDQVEFVGAQDHSALMRIMAEADIIVVPSRYEGFGLTALEAMALSKPVIASTAGGLPEVLGQTGRLIPVGDVDALAAAIAALADDPDARNEMGAAARARAEAAFSLSAIAGRLIEIYADLALGHPSHSKPL